MVWIQIRSDVLNCLQRLSQDNKIHSLAGKEFKLELHIKATLCYDALFVGFDSLHPSQQFFSYVRMSLPGLNQY